ncbi:DUF5317 domain-containing protein [Clostridiaceae bacterium 35-E11]
MEGIVIGFIVGKIRGGKFGNFKFLSLRAWPLILLAFLLQISPLFAQKIYLFSKYGSYFYGASFIFLIICMALNIEKKGVWALLIGIIFNTMVVFLNELKMPISFQGLTLAGLESMIEGIKNGQILHYMDLRNVTDWTKLLGKYIVIPKPYPLSKVVSIGDIWMSLGLILFIQGGMRLDPFHHMHRYGKADRMIKFRYIGKN